MADQPLVPDRVHAADGDAPVLLDAALSVPRGGSLAVLDATAPARAPRS